MLGDNPNDAVSSIGSRGDETRNTMARMRADPESETGIPKSELERRKAEARAPQKITVGDGKVIDVKSSARTQQIIQKGAAKYQQSKRRKELADKMEIVKKARWVFGALGFAFVGYLATEYLIPQYARIHERTKLMEMRRVRAEARMQEVIAARDAAALQQASSK